MGTDFKCGCRISRGWYLCKKHEAILIGMLHEETNTISDIVQNKKGRTVKYVNEKPMKDA